MSIETESKPKEETEEEKGKTMNDFEEQKRLEEEGRRETHPEEFPGEKKED